MLRARVIPCLMLRGRGLYKSVKFSSPKYVGDPINAVKIFNEKEVDELIILDTTASLERREPNYDLIGDIASECFMPLAYGGGISSIEHIRQLHRIGVEKVCLNSAAFRNRELVQNACDTFGSSSIIVSVDVKKSFFGKHEVWIDSAKTGTKADPVGYVKELEALGVGEILINSVDRDGTMQGYDLDLLSRVTGAVNTPVIACGGAGTLGHMSAAIHEAHVSAVAAGSMFVFHGKHKAVLINYPDPVEVQSL